jgi:hypothetical protein
MRYGKEKTKRGIRMVLIRYIGTILLNMAICSSSCEWCRSCPISARLTSLSRKLTMMITSEIEVFTMREVVSSAPKVASYSSRFCVVLIWRMKAKLSTMSVSETLHVSSMRRKRSDGENSRLTQWIVDGSGATSTVATRRSGQWWARLSSACCRLTWICSTARTSWRTRPTAARKRWRPNGEFSNAEVTYVRPALRAPVLVDASLAAGASVASSAAAEGGEGSRGEAACAACVGSSPSDVVAVPALTIALALVNLCHASVRAPAVWSTPRFAAAIV